MGTRWLRQKTKPLSFILRDDIYCYFPSSQDYAPWGPLLRSLLAWSALPRTRAGATFLHLHRVSEIVQKTGTLGARLLRSAQSGNPQTAAARPAPLGSDLLSHASLAPGTRWGAHSHPHASSSYPSGDMAKDGRHRTVPGGGRCKGSCDGVLTLKSLPRDAVRRNGGQETPQWQ